MPLQLFAMFPADLRTAIEHLPASLLETLEEIRIREERPLEIGYGGRFAFVRPDGTTTDDPRAAYRPGRETCRTLLERVTNHSLYAVEEELRRGFVTVAGGHRIGLAGRTVLEGGAVRHLRDIASFNVRIARARTGCAAELLPHLLDPQARTVRHALIVSAPQQGKTTMLRDLARAISAGQWYHPAASGWGGRKVGIVDERSEIAACERGVPTFDLGPRSDVLDACPKAEGLMMLVRSMSPEVVVVDEIGRPEDAYALTEALHAGVRVLATAHAVDLADVFARPVLAQLAQEGMFSAYVLLSRSQGRVMHRIVSAEEAADLRTRQAGRRTWAAPRDAPDAAPTPQARSPNAAEADGPVEAAGARLSIKPRPLPVIRSPSTPAKEGT
ncbi:stage III sporulation protein AA [Cohnella nanjingensis]|uniref:Stage III sporulation protein AA n=1 Tax=Cohnella nanjingensis TaxID=1387779 RepID=A0A7X0RX36_9BACL|nr:stage III sporulation protein AA [Cohnella nanjingensis]MBB6675246.1 stage III sporulation protein AA [Cohnella nanjingensis]